MNKEEKPMRLQGTFLYYDKENLNGRIYSKEICKDIVEQFGEMKHKHGHIFGEIEPNYDNNCNEIDVRDISHEIDEIHLDEESKSIVGTIKVLDKLPRGALLKNILEKTNVDYFSVASRGYGNLNSSTNEVENYKLISFDIIPKENSSEKGSIQISDL
jgi:hypothetical protein